MLTAETKRHIDAARDVLVGKVPDPKSQVQEITNALIYKFMDDMDERAVTMGGKRRFFTGEYEKFSWRKIMDPRIGAHERIGLYTEALSRLSKNLNLPELFRGIFRNAYLPFNDGRTLTLFLTEINFFDYRHQEELGDAYEYLLSIMGSQGDAGQFRTPRHIIDFIVKVVDPSKDDTVLDPACGTAGFLISAYKHVLSKHDGKDDPGKTEKPLTADEKRKLHESYRGFDIDDNMVKMAQVNLYLHGFPEPNILVHDTLSSQDYWQDRYSVIMANPPFMTPKGGIVPHNKFGVQSNRAEVLFVDYIMSHLKPNGRAGIIVPEGIIFQSTTAHKQLRKNLINDGLYAVVSLPSGVFNPYAGVKTSILFFDNDRAKQQSEILFIKITKEGYDLGAQRRPLCNDNNDKPEWCPKHSDFPEALETLRKWKEAVKTENPLALFLPKEKIVESGDYNLTCDRYRSRSEKVNNTWRMVKFGEIFELTNKDRVKDKIDVPIMSITMHNGLIDQNEKFKKRIASQDLSSYKLVHRNELVVGFPIDEGVLGFQIKYDYAAVSPAYEIWKLRSEQNVTISYLETILRSDSARNIYKAMMRGSVSRRRSVPRSDFINIEIPLPPLEIQQQIVAELDGYQNIITGARQVVDNWKPNIDIDPGWEKVKLGEVADIIGGYAFKSEDLLDTLHDNSYPVIKIGNLLKEGIIDLSSVQYHHFLPDLSKFLIKAGDILIAMTGATVGKVAVSNNSDMLLNQRVGLVRVKTNNAIQQYVQYQLLSPDFYNYCQRTAGGGAQGNISPSQIMNYEISLPSIESQNKIIEIIQQEQSVIDANKKLIAMYEQKMKDVIAKIWNGRYRN